MSSSKHYARNVVQVVVYGKPLSSKFPLLNEIPDRSRGSGFFIRFGNEKTPIYILTAAHVVEDAFIENGVKIILPLFGQKEIDSKVIAVAPEIDLAVLKIDVKGLETFIDSFDIGNDHDLEFGSEIPLLVLGYPLGQEQLKVLRCNFSGRQDMGIQTDCAVNKGNSGGPIIFKNKIMGWVSSGVHPTMGHNVSWAIPINQFTAVLPMIYPLLNQNKPTVLHIPHAGIMYHNSSSEEDNLCSGVIIQHVSQFSSLHNFAKVGDKLCSINVGNVTYKLDSRGEVSVDWYFARLPFSQIAAEIPVGKEITFNLLDSTTNQIKSKKTILNFPNRGGFLFHSLRYEPIEYELCAGLIVMPFRGNHMNDFPQLRTSMKPSDREKDWLLVTHTVPGSRIYETGSIVPGDVLSSVNDHKVHTLDEYKKALQKPITTQTGQLGIKFVTTENAIMVLLVSDFLKYEDSYCKQMGVNVSPIVAILRSNNQIISKI